MALLDPALESDFDPYCAFVGVPADGMPATSRLTATPGPLTHVVQVVNLSFLSGGCPAVGIKYGVLGIPRSDEKCPKSVVPGAQKDDHFAKVLFLGFPRQKGALLVTPGTLAGRLDPSPADLRLLAGVTRTKPNEPFLVTSSSKCPFSHFGVTSLDGNDGIWNVEKVKKSGQKWLAV